LVPFLGRTRRVLPFTSKTALKRLLGLFLSITQKQGLNFQLCLLQAFHSLLLELRFADQLLMKLSGS
jgi:hypothetical protein